MHIVFVGLKGATRHNRACDTRLRYVRQLLEERHEVTISELSLLEPLRLLRLHRNKPASVLHVYCAHYWQMLFYWLFSRIIGCKVVYQYVEYRSAFHWDGGRKKNWLVIQYQRLNGYLCDHYGARLWDGCIAISDFLRNHALEVNPRLEVVKVPPLCDMEQFENNQLPSPVGKPYIFYCGNSEYKDVAETIQKAYDESVIKETVQLIMLINGRLDYDKLVAYYKHAEALLIPLRNEIADIARFPNKVCEYCASRGVVITTPYGEMPHYFEDGKNAIMATDYSVSALTDCFNRIADGYYDMDALREASWQTAIEHFSLDACREDLFHFLEGIVSKR